jgi:hypothetical protein
MGDVQKTGFVLPKSCTMTRGTNRAAHRASLVLRRGGARQRRLGQWPYAHCRRDLLSFWRA